jgi:hypothetical protein
MKTHLCFILAHYMVYIGSRLGLEFSKESEQLILKEAHARWHKEGIFAWLSSEEDLQDEHYPNDGNGLPLVSGGG